MARTAQRIKNHPTDEGLAFVVRFGKPNAGWARVDRKVLDPSACQGQGTGTSSKDGVSGKLHRSRRRPARGSAKRSELRSDASWQVHHPADGVDRSGHGTEDFFKVRRVSRARSGVGAEPAPTGVGKKTPAGSSFTRGRGLRLQIIGDAIGNKRKAYAPN